MINQIQIYPDPSASQTDKGNFFEELLRLIMETQRYRVVQQISFTGTEIDLLCDHMDRQDDHAIVECKARTSINANDIKSFTFDVLIKNRAEYGFFVHTSEIHHHAAGMVDELKTGDQSRRLIFWGPDKVIELLQSSHLIEPPPYLQPRGLTPTKRILVYSFLGRFWITLFSSQIVPTHYHVVDASAPSREVPLNTIKWISEFDELNGLSRYEETRPTFLPADLLNLDAVAEVQEAEQWDDYRPVGTRYFVGRRDIRDRLYKFVQLTSSTYSARRVFFIEGKSGWGKSSLIAELRARSRNQRNKNTFFVLALDSRSATTSEFISLSIAKLIDKATKAGFIPQIFAGTNIASSFDVLASQQMQELLVWLKTNNRILVIIFDQFEDVFRKESLFRTFHKLMADIQDLSGNMIVGFSWKSEINIPIDNPAYGLWQQARSFAETFYVEEFLGFEVDQVLKQLESTSGHQIPADLKRRLKEGSQRFPWLTKKLSIHCYHQLRKGVTPEELVDQNLNVDVLFNTDMENLSADETRALKTIAHRGYDGNSFGVEEIDEVLQEEFINSLLSKRLIVRSGSKYNIYWDIFRDFLVEGKVPAFGESFLLRQYPQPCLRVMQILIEYFPCSIDQVMKRVAQKQKRTSPKQQGTTLNHLRELRYLGVVTKVQEQYHLRPSIHNITDFKSYVHERLSSHIVVRSLGKITGDIITRENVVEALKDNFRGYGFAQKTWETYASYMIAWLQYAGIDFNRRLVSISTRASGPASSFTPQMRPEKDIELFLIVRKLPEPKDRSPHSTKGLYDLKALGLLVYEGKYIIFTNRGVVLSKLDDKSVRREIAKFALDNPKISLAYEAWKGSLTSDSTAFEKILSPVLNSIPSASYREVTLNVLRAWGRFIFEELG
jgi:hypothetical protein